MKIPYLDSKKRYILFIILILSLSYFGKNVKTIKEENKGDIKK